MSERERIDALQNRWTQPPAIFPAPGYAAPGVQALFYEGLPYHGRATRVFAWMGIPEVTPGEACPGMVLLHGGGGTAFDEWVRLWVSRGYAAIAMDLCGCVPERPHPLHRTTHERHPNGGPPGWDASFDQMGEPVEDHWTFHAAGAALAAHALLAAQPGVNPTRIGLTGISWGGYLTCVVAGLGPQFCAAVPVYGCGFLGRDSVWNDTAFPQRQPEQVQRWLDLWDPAQYLAAARMPMCWVSGTNDFAYPLSSLRDSYQLPTGPQALCIRIEMPHSHADGWNPVEIATFMESVTCGGDPLPHIHGQSCEGRKVSAMCESVRPVMRAELCFTRARGPWTDRKWNSLPATFDPASGRVEASLPPKTSAWFLRVCDGRDCGVSTPHETVGSLLLFDFDGVIADSECVFRECVAAVCRQHGYPPLGDADGFLELFDTNMVAGLRRLGLPPDAVPTLLHELGQRLALVADRYPPFPGIAEVLRKLARTAPVYVVTSNLTSVVADYLARHHIQGIRDVLGSDKEPSKVAKIRQIAAQWPDLHPVYVGDTLGDMEEAHTAGALPVAACWGWHDEGRLSRGRPYRFVRAPDELLACASEVDGLLPPTRPQSSRARTR